MNWKITPLRVVDAVMKCITFLTVSTFISLYDQFNSYNLIVIYAIGFVWALSALIEEDAKCVEGEQRGKNGID